VTVGDVRLSGEGCCSRSTHYGFGSCSLDGPLLAVSESASGSAIAWNRYRKKQIEIWRRTVIGFVTASTGDVSAPEMLCPTRQTGCDHHAGGSLTVCDRPSAAKPHAVAGSGSETSTQNADCPHSHSSTSTSTGTKPSGQTVTSTVTVFVSFADHPVVHHGA